MNVSLVIKYFCKVRNMVVVIGGDCIDIQLVVLEILIYCLILIGKFLLDELVFSIVEYVEIFVLLVECEIFFIVEIINRIFESVCLYEFVKVEFVKNFIV